MIGHECGKDCFQPFQIAGFFVVVPFSPRHNIRPGAGRIESRKGILPIGLGYFATDEAIRVLFSIEVIQRTLKIERTPPVDSEAGDKTRIPHEQIAIEGRIAIVGGKIIRKGREFQVAESHFPGPPVTVNR